MNPNPYSAPESREPSTDLESVSRSSRLLHAFLAMIAGIGCSFAVLASIATMFGLYRFGSYLTPSRALLGGCASLAYVFVAFGFAIAARGWWQLQGKKAIAWSAGSIAGLILIDPMANFILDMIGQPATLSFLLFAVILGILFLARPISRRVRVVSARDKGIVETSTDASSSPTEFPNAQPKAFCSICQKEVLIDEEDRCQECHWPV